MPKENPLKTAVRDATSAAESKKAMYELRKATREKARMQRVGTDIPYGLPPKIPMDFNGTEPLRYYRSGGARKRNY